MSPIQNTLDWDMVHKPNFIRINDCNYDYEPVIDASSRDFDPIPTEFRVLNESGTMCEPSAENMTNYF